MGYSINDLKNAANMLESSLEQRSQRRAQELVGRLSGKKKKVSQQNNEGASTESGKGKMGSGWGSNGW